MYASFFVNNILFAGECDWTISMILSVYFFFSNLIYFTTMKIKKGINPVQTSFQKGARRKKGLLVKKIHLYERKRDGNERDLLYYKNPKNNSRFQKKKTSEKLYQQYDHGLYWTWSCFRDTKSSFDYKKWVAAYSTLLYSRWCI